MSEKYNDGVLDLQFDHIEKSVSKVKEDVLSHMDDQFEAKMGVLGETLTQVKKTNGRVTWLEKAVYTSMGALPLLTFWATWLTYEQLNKPEPQISEEVMTAALKEALLNFQTEN